MVAAVYGWAWLSVDRSTIARAMIWKESDVDDQYRFPVRPIPAETGASPLPSAPTDTQLRAVAAEGDHTDVALDDRLEQTDTEAFLVVHNDRLVYERYFADSERTTLQTSFSVAKSFVSTLVGIAIDEGHIGSVDQAVTDYLPELAVRDQQFELITLRDLLTMESGIRYREQGLPLPWGDDVYTYYGVDLRQVALDRTEIEQPSGREWHYNNYVPLLLGLVLERATAMSVSEYMATRLWQPLGAEHDATWNLDSESSGFEKMESGLNASAIDYARFGLLFLHDGEWNGQRIVPADWVRAATTADAVADGAPFYRYLWWIDVVEPGRYYAVGKYGQYIYVAPDVDVVIVRLGRDSGLAHEGWLATFRGIADQLMQEN
jgi:CubicO group peptidase (beta-lactamase class C family)